MTKAEFTAWSKEARESAQTALLVNCHWRNSWHGSTATDSDKVNNGLTGRFIISEEREVHVRSNTKNAKGSGTIRKRSDGRWEARYTTGIDPKTGKQTQKSVYGKTQKEVRQKLTEVTAEIDSGTYLEQTKDTVGEWLDTWLKTYALYSVKSYTYDAYERSCNIHIKPALGRIRLSALTAPQIQQFYNSLITEKELSPKTVKNIHGVLHRALGQAVKLGMLRSNPTNVCDLPKAHRKEIKPMEQAEITKFLQAIQGTKYGLVYQITLFTGLREGEVLGLTWDCIDFQHNAIYINKQLQKTKKVAVRTALPQRRTAAAERFLTAPICDGAVPKTKKPAGANASVGRRSMEQFVEFGVYQMSWVAICAIVQSIKSLRQL